MAIFVDENTKVVVPGPHRRPGPLPRPAQQGLRHPGRRPASRPGKGGQDVEGIPVFDTVAEAVAATGADASFIAVPPKAAPAAILEAAEAGIAFIVCITEGIPAQDEARVYNTLVRDFPGTRLLGPNCPGVISPGKCNIGITAGEIALPPQDGQPAVGIVSPLRHAHLPGAVRAEAAGHRRHRRASASAATPCPARASSTACAEFEADPDTHAVHHDRRDRRLGRGGGGRVHRGQRDASRCAAYIAGVTAPAGKKMGHAGAIVSGGKGTAQGKMDALRPPACRSGLNPTEAGELMVEIVEDALKARQPGGGARRPRRRSR